MTTAAAGLTAQELALVAQAQKDARKAFHVLRETRTLSASGTLSFVQRLGDSEKLVNLGYVGLWGDDPDEVATSVVGFDGTVYLGKGAGQGEGRYTRLFKEFPDFQTIAHIHTPHLGAYSQAHLPLPLLYVPNRRFRKVAELPVYIDRRQQEVDFIVDVLRKDKEIPAIIEANGGATAWSFKGLIDLAKDIILLEEGAWFQVLASGLGASKPFGPGVLTQQWRMGGLIPRDAVVDEDGTIRYAAAAE